MIQPSNDLLIVINYRNSTNFGSFAVGPFHKFNASRLTCISTRYTGSMSRG